MPHEYLGPIVTGDNLQSELRHRRSVDEFKAVTGASKKAISEKVALEEKEGWRVVRKNTKSTRMAKPKAADEQLEDEVWSTLAQMGFVTSRTVVWLFLEQLRLQFVPVLHRLQGRLAAQS